MSEFTPLLVTMKLATPPAMTPKGIPVILDSLLFRSLMQVRPNFAWARARLAETVAIEDEVSLCGGMMVTAAGPIRSETRPVYRRLASRTEMFDWPLEIGYKSFPQTIFSACDQITTAGTSCRYRIVWSDEIAFRCVGDADKVAWLLSQISFATPGAQIGLGQIASVTVVETAADGDLRRWAVTDGAGHLTRPTPEGWVNDVEGVPGRIRRFPPYWSGDEEPGLIPLPLEVRGRRRARTA